MCLTQGASGPLPNQLEGNNRLGVSQRETLPDGPDVHSR